MKKFKTAVLVCALSSMLFAGCTSGVTTNTGKYDTVGTINGQAIDYDLFYFAARYEQANYEAENLQVLGEDMWSVTMGDNVTLEESRKQEVLQGIEKMVLLESRAEDFKVVLTTEEIANIGKSAKQFLEDNSDRTIEMMGANEEVVKEYLRLYTISTKVFERIASEEKDEKVKTAHANEVVEQMMQKAEIEINREALGSVVFDGHFENVSK